MLVEELVACILEFKIVSKKRRKSCLDAYLVQEMN